MSSDHEVCHIEEEPANYTEVSHVGQTSAMLGENLDGMTNNRSEY